MKNLIGTEKQVRFANDLVNDFLSPLKERNELLESRGLENLKESHQRRYAENKEWIEAVENMTLENASEVINIFENIRGGTWTLDMFKKAIQK